MLVMLVCACVCVRVCVCVCMCARLRSCAGMHPRLGLARPTSQGFKGPCAAATLRLKMSHSTVHGCWRLYVSPRAHANAQTYTCTHCCLAPLLSASHHSCQPHAPLSATTCVTKPEALLCPFARRIHMRCTASGGVAELADAIIYRQSSSIISLNRYELSEARHYSSFLCLPCLNARTTLQPHPLLVLRWHCLCVHSHLCA